MPAHCGIYNLVSNKFYIRKYWDLEKIDIPSGTEVDMLENLLIDAVKIRTQTTVPTALYYSGGIDSELINSVHAFKSNYTYVDRDYRDEFYYLLPKIVWHLDYPVKSFSAFGLWKLGEWVHRDGFKVVISGEGADELFGGYIRYIQPHFNWLAQKKFPSYKTMFKPAQSVDDSGWIEFCGNLRELLRMGDRMSSEWGLENRCPFLDKRIIQFAFSLENQWKIDGLETKVILREILRKRVPEYKDMEKTGLFCSVNKWIGSKEGFGKKDWLKVQYETLGNKK